MRLFQHMLFILTVICVTLLPAGADDFISIQNIDTQTEFPAIKITVSVSGIKGMHTGGLTDDHFAVYEDGYRAGWTKVSPMGQTNDMLYLVFSIDSSKSISREFLKSIKCQAREIVSSNAPGDRIAVYRFDDTVRLLNSFTEKKKDLLNSIQSIERHGKKTMLFDSIYDSMELLNTVEGKNKKIIVFTDGKDEGSSIQATDIAVLARKKGIPVYFITLSSSRYLTTMSRIAKLTGGKVVYSSKHSDVADMYRTVLSAMKTVYMVNYKTRQPADGSEHTVKVRINYKGIQGTDEKAVTYLKKQGFSLPEISLNKDFLFIGLVVLLIIALVVMVLLISKRERKEYKEVYEQQALKPGIKKHFEEVIKRDSQEQKEAHVPVLEDDSEYSYASAWLVQKDGPEAGKKFPIYWDEVTLGSGKDNSIVIDDPTVSLYHAKIKHIRKGFHLFDLVSDNGTYLNSNKLLRPRPLYDWDEVRIGRVHFIFRGSKVAQKQE